MSDTELIDKLELGATVERLTRERDEALAVTSQAIQEAVQQHARDFQLKEPNRLIKQDDRIAALTASLAERDLALTGIRADIECNEHPEGCASDRDCCVECGWEFDEHPVALEQGKRCEEFVSNPCDCWLKDTLASLPAPGPLAEAVRAIARAWEDSGEQMQLGEATVEQERELFDALDRLAALTPASWREVKP